jgi:hypothetical protein
MSRGPARDPEVVYGACRDEIVSAPVWNRRRDRRAAGVLFLLVWVIYLATATYDMVQITDTRAAAISAWSVATRGTPALPDEWQGSVPWETEGRGGRLFTDRFPGTIAAGVPFYVAARTIGVVPAPSHPVFLNYAPAGVAAATIAAVTVGLMFVLLRRLTDRRVALVASLVFALGTAHWSVSAAALWTHGVTSLALVGGMLGVSAGRSVLGGLSYGVSVLARPQTAVVPAITGLWRSAVARDPRPALAIGLTSGAAVALLSLYSQVLFGTWLPIAGYNPAKVEALATTSLAVFAERWLQSLLHVERGVLVYTPVAAVMLPMVWRAWRASPDWVRSSAVAGLVYLAVQLRSNAAHGGGHYFGSRLTIEALVLSVPLFVRSWQVTFASQRLLRTIVILAAVVSIGIHAVGATILSVSPAGREHFEESLVELCTEGAVPPECFDRR